MTPFDHTWPHTTDRTRLRLLTMDDAESMHTYRSLPQVCRFLSHGPLMLVEVEQRIRSRLPENQPPAGNVTCGVAIDVEGQVVGDAMLRQDTEQRHIWIGYALHPSVWGCGLATEVATALVDIGLSLGLPVWADSYAENLASQRVLEHAGFALHHEALDGDRLMRVFTHRLEMT